MYLVYELYEYFFGSDGLEKELEDEDNHNTSPTPVNNTTASNVTANGNEASPSPAGNNGGPVVTSGLGADRGNHSHAGVDAGFNGNPSGKSVFSVDDGEVISAGQQSGYGNIVEVKNSDGSVSKYAHLAEFKVAKGSKIKKGEILGIMGSTGASSGNHLHYEKWKDGENKTTKTEALAALKPQNVPGASPVSPVQVAASDVMGNGGNEIMTASAAINDNKNNPSKQQAPVVAQTNNYNSMSKSPAFAAGMNAYDQSFGKYLVSRTT